MSEAFKQINNIEKSLAIHVFTILSEKTLSNSATYSDFDEIHIKIVASCSII